MKTKPFLLILLTLLLLTACSSNQEEYLNEEQSPGVEHPESAGFRVITRTELDPPEPAYIFTLTDQNSEPFHMQDLQGSVVMMTFIYTHCPEACPLVAANFKAVQNQLPEDIAQDRLVQVLVTTDPEHDTPDRLLHYTKALGGDWYFVTGTLDEVAEVWEGYDVYWEIRDRTAEVVVYHTYKTILIDKNGDIRYEFIGVWFPDDIIPDIQILLNELN